LEAGVVVVVVVVVVVPAALELPLVGRARGKKAIVLYCGGVNIVLACGIIRSDVRKNHLLGRETHSLSSVCGSLRFAGGHEDWREDSTTSLSSCSGRKHESSFTKQGPNTMLRITTV
jgi:hypothetical protein